MNNPVYVGIENEFQLMEDCREIDFTDDTWNELISLYNNPYFEKEETCMRNRVGSSIYVDSEVLEIATHPVRVEPGFVQKAADSLYLARKELVDFVNPQHWRPIEYYRLIGYSMHWNISNVVRQANPYDILKRLAIPYSLFALNPLSCGINIRRKDENSEA